MSDYMSAFRTGYRDAKYGFTYLPDNLDGYMDGFNFYCAQREADLINDSSDYLMLDEEEED